MTIEETHEGEDAPKDEPAPEEAVPAEEASAEEPTTPDGTPAEDVPTAEEAPAEEASAEEPATPDAAPAEQSSTAGEAPAEEPPAAEEPPVEEAVPAEEPPAAKEPPPAAAKPRPKRDRKPEKKDEPEVIPGAHLEPDLVLEDTTAGRDEVGALVGAEIEAAEQALGEEDGDAAEDSAPEAPAPVPTTVLDLAADARYRATGKRKSAVARVVLKPGTGVYTVNGREMSAFFPRPTLQTIVRQPLQTVGHEERMDVVAKIHGGGVSAQAGALRHGISKALTEADPNLRGELKSRGFLTRDARVKERKKAGLKKARKRPQFSKR